MVLGRRCRGRKSYALTGAAQTLLITLYAHVLDARSAHPFLADTRAIQVARRLDYDFSRLGLGAPTATGIAARALLLDRWTREFLNRHPEAVVLHLGCGLDSRAERLDPGPGVRWFDVDQPDVLALRERVYRPRTGYHGIPASATDPAWLSQVPRGLPSVVVAEGLTMYLPAVEGLLLLNRLLAHLRCDEMASKPSAASACAVSRGCRRCDGRERTWDGLSTTRDRWSSKCQGFGWSPR